jgi:hypothetical protein
MPRFGWKRAKHSVITLADRARDVGQWELAAEYYRDALHRKPKNPPIWVQYGHVLKESGHLAEAESAYRTALAYDQRLADAHLQLGLVLKIQGKKEEAWEACLRALALDPSLATEAALRAELEQRAANEAQLRLEIEQRALAEAVLRTALAQAEHGVQERAAAGEKLQAELDLVRGALAIDVRSPETGGETMVAPPPASAPAPPTSIVSPADCGVVPAQPIIGESVGRTTLIIDASGLFDEKWYLLSNPEVKEAGTNPLRHYVEFGWKEGRDPHPLFDTDWYLERRPDVKEAGVNPLRHFVESGWTEGSDPNPLFDTDWYLEENPDVGVSGTIPLLHYLRYGAVEGRNPHPLFDTNFYVQQNVDVRYAGINPLTHYLIFSGTQRYRPSPIFDADWYLKQNPDVAAAQVNPLLHYLYSGATEGRNPNPFFDTKWYCINNPEVATADINPLVHYVRFGAAQGRDPHPQFSTSHYLADNPDVAAAGINPLAHYLTSGAGRFPFLVEHSEQMLYKPSFLILIETHTGGLISETVISLENQIYPHWRAYLIHSYAWDDAKNLPEGEFLIPIRAGDILSPEALYEFANALNVCPDWDMVYADEDRMLTNDRRGEPFYKPDWSPDYLETFNYVGYPACFRRNVAEGCCLGYGYYGFVLRFTEKTKQISHI